MHRERNLYIRYGSKLKIWSHSSQQYAIKAKFTITHVNKSIYFEFSMCGVAFSINLHSRKAYFKFMITVELPENLQHQQTCHKHVINIHTCVHGVQAHTPACSYYKQSKPIFCILQSCTKCCAKKHHNTVHSFNPLIITWWRLIPLLLMTSSIQTVPTWLQSCLNHFEPVTSFSHSYINLTLWSNLRQHVSLQKEPNLVIMWIYAQNAYESHMSHQSLSKFSRGWRKQKLAIYFQNF